MLDRRSLLAATGAGMIGAGAIGRALAIDADVRRGSLMDVAHVVILMQENRGFDHYFGSLPGVRGFGDRFPIPVAGRPRQTVWAQRHGDAACVPFHLDTQAQFALMCAEGTPHTWPDAQAAWDEGRMSRWADAKTVRALGHYRGGDLPFQFALAEAFTLCDAYHCSVQTGTNTNRLFLWSGTNDPTGIAGGPAIGNSHDSLVADGGHPDGYRWTTYVERLQAAGIDWRIYQDMKDNFSDNPLAGFRVFRDALAGGAGHPNQDLAARGLGTHTLDRLRADVVAGTLPQVSYVIADAAHSEHPAASSPAQGADYTARVLDALTADPAVWSRTALLVMFDENDGFFDHVPPPAPPSRMGTRLAGAARAATAADYHLVRSEADAASERPEWSGRPYGLGPRVPLYVISPWSRGGWVDSQVFDHTSVIRFLERRFGVIEPNISPWRRAVCGDLTSAFDFVRPNDRANWPALPATAPRAQAAAAVKGRMPAAPPSAPAAPEQKRGVRRSRALPYALAVEAAVTGGRIALTFANAGTAGAVVHVYDRHRLDQVPRRYTVEPGERLTDDWMLTGAGYDLWVLGPNGFHRHFAGAAGAGMPEAVLSADAALPSIAIAVRHPGDAAARIVAQPLAYGAALAPQRFVLAPGAVETARWSLAETAGWYDIAVRIEGDRHFLRRFAGRIESGRDGIADPALGGPALLRHVL